MSRIASFETFDGRLKLLDISTGSREKLFLAGVTILAVLLRVYRVDALPLWGDEYASVSEALNVGSNPHSIPYFAVLRAWIALFGQGEIALRMLSIVFGVLAVPVTYLLGRELFDRRVGVLAGVLLATSGYAIGASQFLRFYSFLLFSAVLCYYLFVLHHRLPRRTSIPLVLANLLCVSAFLMGFVVPAIQLLSRYLLSLTSQNAFRRVLALLALAGLCLALIAWPGVREAGFAFVLRMTHGGDVPYLGMRGVSIVSIAKVSLAFFFFTFGERVYPLDIPVVLPGILLCGWLFVVGFWTMRKLRLQFTLLATSFVVALGLVYVVFDSLIPVSYEESAQPIFVIYLLPLYYIVLANGVVQMGRWSPLFAGGLLVLNLYVLINHWAPTWSYRVPLVDWRSAANFVGDHGDDRTGVLYYGLATGPVRYYFPASVTSRGGWGFRDGDSLDDLRLFDRLVFVSYDSGDRLRRGLDDVLARIESRFEYDDGYVDYPLFVYEYREKGKPGYAVDPLTGAIGLPKESYGLPFSDLRLPQVVDFGGVALSVAGSFALPSSDGSREKTIPLRASPAGTGLVLLTNVTEASDLPEGVAVAEISIDTEDGEPARFSLRYGSETGDWSKACPSSPPAAPGCEIAYSWHKRAAMVGRRSYEGAWRDFQAHIFGTTLSFAKPLSPKAIRIRYLADRGTLNIWGAGFKLQTGTSGS